MTSVNDTVAAIWEKWGLGERTWIKDDINYRAQIIEHIIREAYNSGYNEACPLGGLDGT